MSGGQEEIQRAIQDATSLAQNGNPSAALHTLLHALSRLDNGEREVVSSLTYVINAMKGMEIHRDGDNEEWYLETVSQLEGVLQGLSLSCACNMENGDTKDDTEMSDTHSHISSTKYSVSQNYCDNYGWSKEMGVARHYAPADESPSFVCHRCGDIISEKRRQAHEDIWCRAISHDME